MKLLVVDDSALMRRYLSEMLGSVVGISVTTARDGQDALEVRTSSTTPGSSGKGRVLGQ